MSTIWKVTINNEEPVWMVSLSKPTGEELSKRLDVIQDYFNSYEGKRNSLQVETFKGFVIPSGKQKNWCQKLSRATFVEVAAESFLDGLQGDEPVILGLEKPLNLSI